MRPRFLGDAGSGISAAASPILHIKGKICPFLMAHGDEDFPHLVIQANEMEEALVASGATVDRTVLSNCDHFGTHYACGEDGGDWFGKILNFIAA